MIGLSGSRLESDDLSPLRKYLPITTRFVKHAAIAAIGCMVLGLLLLNFLHIRAQGPHYFTILFFTDVPYSPVFWGSAFLVGFALNRESEDRVAYWLGPIALLGFALLIIGSVPGNVKGPYEIAPHHSFMRYIWGGFFSIDPNKCPADECLDKLLFTAPVLNCVAYSVGAKLGMFTKQTVSDAASRHIS
jgi:hypothetical protein